MSTDKNNHQPANSLFGPDTAEKLTVAGEAQVRHNILKKNMDEESFTDPAYTVPGKEPTISNQGRSTRKKVEKRIRQLAERSDKVLFSTKTVFPFDFFPDTLTINGNKIDLVISNFFFSSATTSIPLRDIANVEIETSPFFAKLKIVNIRYPMEPVEMSYLKKGEAVKAKNIIDGLLVSMSQGADVAAVDPKKMQAHIEKVGTSAVED
jgi:hypothetical protein